MAASVPGPAALLDVREVWRRERGAIQFLLEMWDQPRCKDWLAGSPEPCGGKRTIAMPLDSSLQKRRDRTAAVAASIRSASIRGKLGGAFILLLGGIFAALLSGFGVWTSHLSFITVTGALIAAALSSWIGAVVLRTAPLAALLFSAPMAVGLVFAALSKQWWGCAVLLSCMSIPFAALALYRFDQRKPDHSR
jgi:hypothetical protein